MSTLACQQHHPDCHPSSFKVNISSVIFGDATTMMCDSQFGYGSKPTTQPSKIVGKWVPNATLVKMSSSSLNQFNRAASLSVISSWHPIVPIKKISRMVSMLGSGWTTSSSRATSFFSLLLGVMHMVRGQNPGTVPTVP